ncbi:MAG TPA: hypothetical protein VFV33_06940 [Gemmatimonadaceae bacterium]|nr:hypothetical protein [Gemmatimonadaceae bacterium]
MTSPLRRLAFATLFVTALGAMGTEASAQSAPPRKIAPGTYQIVPDQNFSGGMDVSVFTARFDGDSIMVIEQGGMMMTRSRVAYEGEHLTWTDLEGSLMCPGTAKDKLSISEDGKTVRLAPVEDGCGERSAIIAQISFVRKE